MSVLLVRAAATTVEAEASKTTPGAGQEPMDNKIDPKVAEPEAAAHCGLAPATLATMRCRGSGPPYFKLGRRVVYSLRDLDKWLAARRVNNTTNAPTYAGRDGGQQ